MSVAIDTVTISSVEDRRLVLSNAQAARVINIGTNWTKVRIGVRMTIEDSGGNILGSPLFYLGMMSAPSAGLANGPLSSTCSNFVGLITDSGTWIRNGTSHYGPATVSASFAKKVGSTIYRYSNTNTGWMVPLVGTNRRGVLVVEITKSPSWVIKTATDPVGNVPDKSLGDFKNIMEAATMANVAALISGSGIEGTSSGASVDEAADGYLDSVCVAWGVSSPVVYISDLAWAKIA